MAGLAVTSLLLYCTYSAILFMAAGQENVVIIMHTRAMIHLPLAPYFFLHRQLFCWNRTRVGVGPRSTAGDVYTCW
jgi:hypothetical protein